MKYNLLWESCFRFVFFALEVCHIFRKLIPSWLVCQAQNTPYADAIFGKTPNHLRSIDTAQAVTFSGNSGTTNKTDMPTEYTNTVQSSRNGPDAPITACPSERGSPRQTAGTCNLSGKCVLLKFCSPLPPGLRRGPHECNRQTVYKVLR